MTRKRSAEELQKLLPSAQKAELRVLLETPFKSKRPAGLALDGLYLSKGSNRRRPSKAQKLYWQKIKQYQADQTKRLFALYDIPDNWKGGQAGGVDEEIIRWQQLAMCLAAEHFAGCRSLSKGPGGPSEERLEWQRALYREFITFEPATKSRTEAAGRFLQDKRKVCLKECRKAKCVDIRNLDGTRRNSMCQDGTLTAKPKNFAAAAARFKQKMNPAAAPAKRRY
jgi:hypothetical protein